MITRISYFLIGIIIFQLQACSQKNEQKDKLIQEGIANFNSHKYKDALNSFDDLIKLDSADFVSWAFRGRTLHLLNRDADAFKSFAKALSINPEYSDGYSYRAVLYSINSEPELALKDINTALLSKKNDTTLLLLQAGFLFKLKKIDSSIKVCNYLIKINPTNAQALYYRGASYKKSENINLALEDFNNSISLNPTDPEVFNDRGFIFISQNKYSLAISDFSKSIQLAGVEDSMAKAYAYNNRGFCLYKSGNLNDALKDMNYSIQLLPINSYAYKNRSLVFLLSISSIATTA